MEDELPSIPTAELVEVIHTRRFKFRSISVASILTQLVGRALSLLQVRIKCYMYRGDYVTADIVALSFMRDSLRRQLDRVF